MSSVSSLSPVRWNDLTHPFDAGSSSVIISDGRVFVLVFQTANFTLRCIGDACWRLVIGMAAYAVLNGQRPRKAASADAPSSTIKRAS